MKEVESKIAYYKFQIGTVHKIAKTIVAVVFREGRIKDLRGLYNNDKVQFDSKAALLGFDDNVYDLSIGEFREYRFDDYISLS